MTHKKNELNEKAALLFLEGQFALRYVEGSRIIIKPLSPASVRAAISAIPIDSGWLPAPLQRWGYTAHGEYVVLFFPAQRYALRLVNDFPDRTAEPELLRLEVPLPPMIFAGTRKMYWVWALNQNELDPEAEVYHAPLPNVWTNANICYGRNHPPLASPRTALKAWQMFIASPFNGHLVNKKSQSQPEDIRQKLLRLSQRRHYPLADLCGTGHSLEQVIVRELSVKGQTDDAYAPEPD